MKNVKNLIAILALVSILGVGNSFAAEQTRNDNGSNQQYSQTAQSWFDSLFNYVKGYLTADSNTAANRGANGGVQTNHNETLVRDEA